MHMAKILVLASAICLGMSNVWAANDTEKNTPGSPPKAVVKEVEACMKKLGADSFRERRKASRRLVEIGDLAIAQNGKKTTPYRAYVRDKLKSLLADKDPEVSGRARKVIKTLYPYEEFDPDHIELKAHTVDSENDTLPDLANTYGSRVEWIKSANPGLRTNMELRRRQTVFVPVVVDDLWDEHHHEVMVIEIDE